MLETKKTVLIGDFEDVISTNNHYYIINKKHKIVVFPYTVNNGLLDKIGLIKTINPITGNTEHNLISNYISEDDNTDMSAANRILFEVLKQNVDDAAKWAYLGLLNDSLFSDSSIKLYAVDISNVDVIENDESTNVKFTVVDSQRAISVDNMLILSAFHRMMQYMYCKSL